MRTAFLLTVTFLLSALPGHASPPRVLASHNLGGSAGTISGIGLAYRHWFANTWGFQVAGFPIFDKSASSTSANVNLGVLGLKSFFHTDGDDLGESGLFTANIFGYGGGSIWYDYSKDEFETISVPGVGRAAVSRSVVEENVRYSLGSGFGFEVGVWRIKWNLMLGVGAYYSDEIVESYGDAEDSFGLIPSAETGLFFGF